MTLLSLFLSFNIFIAQNIWLKKYNIDDELELEEFSLPDKKFSLHFLRLL